MAGFGIFGILSYFRFFTVGRVNVLVLPFLTIWDVLATLPRHTKIEFILTGFVLFSSEPSDIEKYIIYICT